MDPTPTAPPGPHGKIQRKHLELQFLKEKIVALEETITTQSLKALVVCGLELYLSQALVLSLFECTDPAMRDAQELQYMTRMAWIPLVWGLVLAFGHRVLPAVAPAPENLDRNLRNAKLLTWAYTLAFLIWDKDMEIKRGPALQVAAMFSVCDLARYEMEIARLIEDDDDELEGDREVEQMAEAVDAAGRATDQEEALKQLRQAVANRHGDDDDSDDDDAAHQAGGEYVRQASSAAGADYREYAGPTPARQDTGARHQAF